MTVLQTLADSDIETAQRRIADLSSTGKGLTIHLTAPQAAGGEALTLRCVALRKRVLSVDHVGGFVAVLSKTEEERVVANNVVPLATADELNAFVLVTAVEEAVAAVNRTSRRRVILEPSNSIAQSIAKRRILMSALRGFLLESASDQSPVIVIREKPRDVEIVIHDLDLGVPMGAIERVLNAPHHPPPGLEPLGRLILAVEESHGSMRLGKARGWGMRPRHSFAPCSFRGRRRIESVSCGGGCVRGTGAQFDDATGTTPITATPTAGRRVGFYR